MSGAFSSAFSTAFDIIPPIHGGPVPAAPRKELVFTDWVDDHFRPRKGLYAHFMPVPSQQGLLLFRDGTVLQRTTLVLEEYEAADWLAAAGTKQTFAADDWQVQVLINAGYTLVDVAPTVPDGSVYPSGAYGEGIYGAGAYGH